MDIVFLPAGDATAGPAPRPRFRAYYRTEREKVGELPLVSPYQPFTGAAVRIIRPGKVVQDVPVNEPGIMELIGRDVSLAAEPLYRLRVDSKTVARLDDC